PERRAAFEAILGGVPFGQVGVVREGRRFTVKGLDGRPAVDADIFDLKEAWQAPLRSV
ncbi:hypothetical protein HYY27_06350, partial [bacterium]|nr:hypothetical protein [bacterium]